jgi:Laminin B (Domain IV)/PEP-CTERM motif
MRFKEIQSLCWMLILCALLSQQPIVRADISDTFPTDNAGWGHIGDSTTPPAWNATGGNPDGYISVTDLGAGADEYFVAPSKYLGNQSSALNQSLSFDLLLSVANSGPDNDVILSNGSTTLSYLFSPPPLAGGWTHESLILNTSDPHWHLGTIAGPAPSQSDFQNVLSSLTELEILADYGNGAETVGLDNVALHTVPEPSSLALLAIATLISLGWQSIARRRKPPSFASAIPDV